MDKDSAEIKGTVAYALPENHRNIHKFKSRKDPGYLLVLDEIVRMVDKFSGQKKIELEGKGGLTYTLSKTSLQEQDTG